MNECIRMTRAKLRPRREPGSAHDTDKQLNTTASSLLTYLLTYGGGGGIIYSGANYKNIKTSDDGGDGGVQCIYVSNMECQSFLLSLTAAA